MTTGEAVTGLDFALPTRLEAGPGSISGSCVITGSAADGYGVAVALFNADTSAPGRPFRSVTITTRPDSSTGSIDAQLGQDDFESTACQLQVTALDASVGQLSVASTSDCVLAGPAGETATVDFELDFTGCAVR